MAFKAKIYKVGINPCVEVPRTLTEKMKALKGYIPVAGTINGHTFEQTLVPVKNSPYRLYVNIPMLKGSKAKVGDVATFTLKQVVRTGNEYPMNPKLLKALKSNNLAKEFGALTPSRQKEILRYLGGLKTEETLMKNIGRVIDQLKGVPTGTRVP